MSELALRYLLNYWERVVWPLPNDAVNPTHPEFERICAACTLLDAIGEEMMTEVQRAAPRVSGAQFTQSLGRA